MPIWYPKVPATYLTDPAATRPLYTYTREKLRNYAITDVTMCVHMKVVSERLHVPCNMFHRPGNAGNAQTTPPSPPIH